jgi:16S rRNA (guanine966-N2)-methyltransferase
MRVIGGEFRSRVLKTLPGQALRPTPDLLRQALFNVLAPRIEGTVFLDAYAGSGAVGIEALSRGARHAIFIESHAPAVRLIRENLRSLELEPRATVIQGPTRTHLARQTADIVFLDPPYPLDQEYDPTLDLLGKNPPPLVLVQHSKHRTLKENYGVLARTRTLAHGDNIITFFAPERSD